MPRLSKIGAAALAAFGWTSGVSTVTATYLVVAGGGGGGGGYAGGGGAGGYRESTLSLNPTLSYTVTVGAGGGGGAGGASGSLGTSGSDSVFGSITSTGGGRGGAESSKNGANGGSGGGAAGGASSGTAGTGTSGQGNNGGVNATTTYGGGGGGASAAGGTNGNGGAGTASSISGTSVTYAGGGGGGGYNGSGAGTGGAGGGGAGTSNGTTATAGIANTGGGGGGGGEQGGTRGTGGSGGSGVVIISYAGAQQFGGGVVTSSGGNTIHTFNTSGTLGPITPLSANYLVVAGGAGGGGSSYAGGGGAGGLLSGSGLTIDPSSTYLVTVGAGGAGGAGGAFGVNGSNSVFLSITSTGGGGGSFGDGAGGTRTGNSGGSGGGGGSFGSSSTGTGGTGTSGQGNNGGNGGTDGATYRSGGGGGGAGAVGANISSGAGGNGGAGTASSISGSSVTYAGGGGGAGNSSNGTATGGGGSAPSVAGTANLGGGGGGAGASGSGGAGGSGVVIISYAGSTQLMAGGTVTISGGNVIHTFTSTGFLAPLDFVGNSLRFRSSASAYLNRTLTTPTLNTKWTWSGWIKRGSLSNTSQGIFEAPSSGSTFASIYFTSADIINWYEASGGATVYILQTSQVFRDPAAWYHIICAYDSTQATAANRQKMYVNGVQITAFSTATYVAQNTNGRINSAVLHKIGTFDASSNYLDGYQTEVNFIDGQALTPNSFGTINSYGVWQPITYGGSYGTNGFYLPFTNTTSTTTLGYDFSPNGNNWTTNNISLTAGATYDSMTDVPTLTSATAANYPVLNPLVPSTGTITSGNLNVSTATTNATSTTLFASTGKWYWEVVCTSATVTNTRFGIVNTSGAGTDLGGNANGWAYLGDGRVYTNGASSSYGVTYSTNDILMIALDIDAGKIWYGKNGTWMASGSPSTGANPSQTFTANQLMSPAVASGSGTFAYVLNCGQRPFTYTPPSGFVALNTYNL